MKKARPFIFLFVLVGLLSLSSLAMAAPVPVREFISCL